VFETIVIKLNLRLSKFYFYMIDKDSMFNEVIFDLLKLNMFYSSVKIGGCFHIQVSLKICELKYNLETSLCATNEFCLQ